ncbi:bifunctional DNA primase/polymerase [Kitasatospora sp. NPDC093679]|uniref:bifunctional DNA primase/polymerase n=1 Tax=Kitasatospora sp. NPDC093679 TaxID=3154983 RepID=UPI00343C7B79
MDNLFGELRLRHLRLAPRGTLRRTRATTLRAAGEYTSRLGWTVVAGAARTHRRSPGVCDCAAAHCAAPGLHAVPGPKAAPGTPADELRALLAADAPVLLPAGLHFDVLDVPEQPGLQALVRLERMGTQVGPVIASPAGRLLFFVAPGTAPRLPELLYRTGWDDASLDLVCHGAGAYVAAPPTVLGGLGPMRWLRRPTRESAACPPEARLLLGTLAYACHRGRARACEPAWLAS